jgi:hypothetical protein
MVPIAAVNEDGNPVAWKDNVGSATLAGERSTIDEEP